MDKIFICLANSFKYGGRCIAGIEINVTADNHWQIIHNADGSPHWIRPIAKDTDNGEIPEGEAIYIKLLSVVKLTGVVACPHEAHTEDVNYQTMESIGSIISYQEVLDRLTDNVHQTLFYTSDFFIYPECFSNGNYSLMLIRPEGFAFRLDPSKNRAKYYMIFKYNGLEYNLSITDPDFYQYIERHPKDWENLKSIYLSLSIGMEYEGRHHKLIAAIIIPSKLSSTKDPFVFLNDSLYEKSVRPFTFLERLACKQAIVVPSQNGLAVRIKEWMGREYFYAIDKGSLFTPWKTINLRKTILITYVDMRGNQVVRIREKK